MTDCTITSFRDLIDRWPSGRVLAETLTSHGRPVGSGVVKQWRRRDAIPSAYFAALIAAAADAGISGVSAGLLVHLAGRRSSATLGALALPEDIEGEAA